MPAKAGATTTAPAPPGSGPWLGDPGCMLLTMAHGPGKKAPDDILMVMRNRRVSHDFEILERFEAGMVLTGTEVKSLRDHGGQWADAHARLDERGELWLHGLNIAPYRQAAGIFNHEPLATRKLLLHQRQLVRLAGSLRTKGLALVPASIYFRKGWAKIELCLVRGRRKGDKREALRNRERERDAQRDIARRARRG